MKRTDIKTSESKAYNMDLSELYEVMFIKDLGAFSKGEKTHVSLPIAMKWVNKGVVSSTSEITAAAEKYGCTELLKSYKPQQKAE